jgi:hypothetical protein
MMKKGFALTLLTVAIALVQVSTTYATAPVISDPGDVIIGDLENAPNPTSTNVFVAPDILNADTLVSDDTPDNQIKWSFFSNSPDIEINGVTSLDVSLSGLGQDDPTSPRLANRLDQNNDDDGQDVDVEDGNARTFTVRDVSLSPNVANPGDTGPSGPPGVVNGPIVVTLFASDCTTFGARDITVFSIRGESDSLSGGGPEVLFTVDFTDGDNTDLSEDWLGGNSAGFGGTVSSGASGLCMTVPALGNNLVLWFAPETSYVDLTGNAAYRVRSQMSTTQSTPDAIPFWFFIFDNFYLSTPNIGNNYGGFHWVLDVFGGANGIGRANGRTSFDFWYNPNATPTDQWNAGAIAAPAADAVNDTRLQFQVIDANATLLTDNDSGTICIESIAISKQDRDSMQFSTVFSPPIDSSTHFVSNDIPSTPGTTISIDGTNDLVNADLGTSADARASLIPYDENGDGVPGQQLGPLEFYPVVWVDNALHRNRTSIRAATSEADPVDAIFLAIDTASNELGTFSYTTRTGNGVMVFAASPKLASANSTYEAYLYTNNSTDATPLNDRNRLRPQVFPFNTNNLYGAGTGGDALVIDGFELDTITVSD